MRKRKTKNVILIVADALSADNMSLYGYDRLTTPFIDEFFGKKGVVYRNAYSNASWTFPSFASFLRSRLPSQIKVREILSNENTFPKILHDEGIHVVSFLKETQFSITQSIRNAFKNSEHYMFPYHDHKIPFNKAAEWLSTYASKKAPFFLFIHDTTPHNPYDPPEKYRKEFGGTGAEFDNGPLANRVYLNSLSASSVSKEESQRIRLLYDQKIRYLDDLLKTFIHSLSPEILNETAIIFTSDHGDSFGNHYNFFNHGHSLYDELIKIPFCIYIPGAKQANIIDRISLLDLAPTIHSLFEIPIPEKYAGISLFDDKSGIDIGKRVTHAEGNRVIPFNVRGKLEEIDKSAMEQPILNPLEEIAVFKGKWKYYVSKKRGEELYDLSEDRFEKKNIFGKDITSSSQDTNTVGILTNLVKQSTLPAQYLNSNRNVTGPAILFQHHTEALKEYRSIVKQHLYDEAFQSKMILLIEKYPYLVPPYLEILEILEGVGNDKGYKEFISIALNRLKPMFFLFDVTPKILGVLNYEELHSFIRIIGRLEEYCKANPIKIYKLARMKKRIEELLLNSTQPPTKEHLACLKDDINTKIFLDDLKGKEHFWYGSIGRQGRLYYHTFTQIIVLRTVLKENRTEIPIPVDGPHESVRTNVSIFFQHTLQFAENFAHEINCGLGRVALIRLEPRKMAYRHSDREIFLKDRTRYHLIIEADKNNILYSGDEMAFIKSGQLFRYDNKATHKSYNDSTSWRTHLVMDLFQIRK